MLRSRDKRGTPSRPRIQSLLVVVVSVFWLCQHANAVSAVVDIACDRLHDSEVVDIATFLPSDLNSLNGTTLALRVAHCHVAAPAMFNFTAAFATFDEHRRQTLHNASSSALVPPKQLLDGDGGGVIEEGEAELRSIPPMWPFDLSLLFDDVTVTGDGALQLLSAAGVVRGVSITLANSNVNISSSLTSFLSWVDVEQASSVAFSVVNSTVVVLRPESAQNTNPTSAFCVSLAPKSLAPPSYSADGEQGIPGLCPFERFHSSSSQFSVCETGPRSVRLCLCGWRRRHVRHRHGHH